MDRARCAKDLAGVALLALGAACAAASPWAARASVSMPPSQPLTQATPQQPTAGSTPLALDAGAVYARCVQALRQAPRPQYATYSLQVNADHIDITRAYDAAGLPTTTLYFGVRRRTATYLVRYRERDGTAAMRDLASGAITVGPPVPWSLDLWTASPQPAAAESVSSGSVTTDAAGRLLAELRNDQHGYYRISFAHQPEAGHDSGYQLLFAVVSGDPNAHALRELIVDRSSFLPLVAVLQVAQHRFLFGGTLTLNLRFGAVGPYWLNTEGTILGQGHYTIVPVSGSYRYRAADFAFPAQLPDHLTGN